MRMRRWKRWGIALAAVTALVTACSGPRPVAPSEGGGAPSSSSAPVKGGRLVYGISADAAGFNPVTDQFASQTYTMVGTILEPLVAVDASGAWKPYLAQSITPNRDYN